MTGGASCTLARMDRRHAYFAVLVAALGYFVDIYDLVLFGVLRGPSLAALGVPEAERLDVGVSLLNWQMTGMLLGGIAWGILGDRRGRLSVLFGSIALYSLANLGNAAVTSIPAYAALRFIAGVGLAGELGAGITLVSEVMPKEVRGWGTTVVATVGILGAIVAARVGALTSWRTSYVVGGVLGLLLLALRIGVLESGMFARVRESAVRRGDFLSLFTSRDRLGRYARVIAIGVPIWYVVGVLVTFAPEIGKAIGVADPPTGGNAIMFCYLGLAIGDLGSGALSQLFRTRKRIVGAFLAATVGAIAFYFTAGRASASMLLAACLLLGVATGYWAVFVTMASEQFGTNLRATVTTTAPNFVRGATVPATLAFKHLKPLLGVPQAALAVGAVALVIAALALRGLQDTFHRDLDFVEHV